MPLSQCLIYTYIGGMILCGTAMSVCFSLSFSEKSLGVLYIHPWFQTLCMFIGETYCLLIYYFILFINRNNKFKQHEVLKEDKDDLQILTGLNEDNNHPNKDEINSIDVIPMEEIIIDGTPTMVPIEASPFLMFIPAMCDLVGSTLVAFALLNMETSIHQMFKG